MPLPADRIALPSLLSRTLPRSVESGSNVLSREYSYVSASPRNRFALVRCVQKAGGELARGSGSAETWTLADHYEIFRLVCPDFDRSLVARTAHFLGLDEWAPMTFTAAAVAMQHSFFYREFLEAVDAMLPPSGGLDNNGAKGGKQKQKQKQKQSERDVIIAHSAVLLELARCRPLFEFPCGGAAAANANATTTASGSGATAGDTQQPRRRGAKLRRLHAKGDAAVGAEEDERKRPSLYIALDACIRKSFRDSLMSSGSKTATSKGRVRLVCCVCVCVSMLPPSCLWLSLSLS